MSGDADLSSSQEELPAAAEVVVVGAGLAGLAAAVRLHNRGLQVQLVDSADAPGGRIRTDVVDGFRFDRGFQLYNPAYPEGARMFDYPGARLRPFVAGAAIAHGGRRYRLADPRRRPAWLLDSLRAPVGGPLPMARLAAYAARCATTAPTRLSTRPDTSIHDVFVGDGMSGELERNLLQPFLAGVFLERELATSRRFADLILRSFVRGTPAVPALGMQRLPEQLASRLPVDSISLNTEVIRVAPGRVDTDRGTIRAERAVVVAVGPARVNALLPALPSPVTRSCTTWYHRPPPGTELSDGDALLTLGSAGDGPLVVVLSGGNVED
ncbi:MAG TPA: FAD-dependent oxidoreductase, partial [Actinomycetota bacterium]|nr:FAD-dependent oxidoreductase [Actinomycetota bacterium]